jgi:hypothetical protein
MNIEKIFTALKLDEMNSALGIICSELESQGYEVEIEDIKVTSEEIFEEKLKSLEEVPAALNIKLFRDGKEEQKFSIDFTEYHKIVFKEYKNGR